MGEILGNPGILEQGGVSTCSSTHPRMFWDGRDTRGMGEICVEGGGSSLHPRMFLGMG